VRTRKADVVDDLHGTKVPDPYRWLEDADAPEVKAWTDRQNAYTRGVIDQIGGRADLVARLKALLQIGTVTPPLVVHPVGAPPLYFHTKREGEQNQPILYVRSGLHGADRALIEPAAMAKDATTALDWWYPSWDGALVAWGRSEGGSEDSTLFVRDSRTGVDLADKIPQTRHASVAWLPDGKGFYYSRYPEPGSVPAGDEKYFSKIFFHRLGTDPKADPMVFERLEKTDVPQVIISPNGRWLLVRVHMGWDRSELFLRDLSASQAGAGKSEWIEVAAKTLANFEPIPRNDRLYILTNDGASRYKLAAVDYANAGKGRASWKEIIPEGADVLKEVSVQNGVIVAAYMHEASTRIERFTTTGKSLGPIALPALGTATVSGAWNGDEAFVGYASFVAPSTVSRFDLKSQKSEPWDSVGAGFKAPSVTVKLHYATSKDGTKIPMFVVAKEGVKLDGTNPTVLWGYGGFNVNQTPGFSARALLTVERGGVWVTAVLRGGGEFGEAWHQAGMLAKKQNVFDDYIACAETLIAEKITSPRKLAVMGGSNGGLLVAVAVTQRPDLFRVGVSLVPLTDMLRYHRFRIGKLWVSEYGDPDNAEQFETLRAYSPYHHVKEGVTYPSMLFTTAESDSRVDPMHARKMAARMQEVQGSPDRPVLRRVESRAGHGQGKPITKVTEEMADELGFVFRELEASP
jgi:prolyl oligopeptidase